MELMMTLISTRRKKKADNKVDKSSDPLQNVDATTPADDEDDDEAPVALDRGGMPEAARPLVHAHTDVTLPILY